MGSEDFTIEQLFGSKTRAQLLGLFLLHPEDSFFVRELTRRIGAQLNSVRRELKNLVELGIVHEIVENKTEKQTKSLVDKKRFYRVNPDSILYQDLRSLFKKVHILLKQNFVLEIEEKGKIVFFAFTGQFVEKSKAPTDIIIVGDIQEKVLRKLMEKFEADFGQEINYTLMTKEEFSYRKQVADRFLDSVFDGEKIIIINKLGV